MKEQTNNDEQHNKWNLKYSRRNHSRITEAEEQISDLEDKIVEITTREQNKEKRIKTIEDSLRNFWDKIKHTNIQIIGVPEEEDKNKGSDKIFGEIIVENLPNKHWNGNIQSSPGNAESHTGKIQGETCQDTY